MKSVNVSLSSIDKVKEFVSTISATDGDFDLSSNRYKVDAKSIMGIFSLDLSGPLKLEIHDDSTADAVIDKLKSFIV